MLFKLISVHVYHCISLCTSGLTLDFCRFNCSFSSDRLRRRIAYIVLLPLQELNNLGELRYALLVKSEAIMGCLTWIDLNETLCIRAIGSQQVR